jgi:hypothetical protein
MPRRPRKVTRPPSPLMTPREVAHLWHVSPRTVVARTKPGARKRNRVEPCMLTPDLRWKREDVYRDLEAMSFSRELVLRDGRKRRVA